MIYYFAYGSNLHPLRLKERVPAAHLVGVTELSKHRLAFHKQSGDGSGKCNMHQTGSGTDSVLGAIYKFPREHKDILDRFEGNGSGYIDDHVLLGHRGREHACYTYYAQDSHIVDHLRPYHWYKKLVVLGAKYLKFPDSYISAIEAVESVEDQQQQRRQEMGILIDKIRDYS
jgi:hypothetical protein